MSRAQGSTSGAVYEVFQGVCDACPWVTSTHESAEGAEAHLRKHVETFHKTPLEVRYRAE